MRSDCPMLQKLRDEVIAGKITNADIEKRLSAAIEAEYLKPQPDAEFIHLCEDMLWSIGTQGKPPMPSSTNRYLAFIAQHTQPEQPVSTVPRFSRRLAVVMAVFVLIVALSSGAIYIRWFTQYSSPDEQQHVIMGHEITVEMVASSIAENTAQEPIVVSDFSKFKEHLGFDPGIPNVLGNEWVAEYGSIRYFSGYIRLVAIFSNSTTSNQSITCTMNYFTDVEYAYFSFEQTAEGEKETYNGTEIYLSHNMERNSATWYNQHMYVQIAGQLSSDETVPLLFELIGENHE